MQTVSEPTIPSLDSWASTEFFFRSDVSLVEPAHQVLRGQRTAKVVTQAMDEVFRGTVHRRPRGWRALWVRYHVSTIPEADEVLKTSALIWWAARTTVATVRERSGHNAGRRQLVPIRFRSVFALSHMTRGQLLTLS
jgi:hypothetical protein